MCRSSRQDRWGGWPDRRPATRAFSSIAAQLLGWNDVEEAFCPGDRDGCPAIAASFVHQLVYNFVFSRRGGFRDWQRCGGNIGAALSHLFADVLGRGGDECAIFGIELTDLSQYYTGLVAAFDDDVLVQGERRAWFGESRLEGDFIYGCLGNAARRKRPGCGSALGGGPCLCGHRF